MNPCEVIPHVEDRQHVNVVVHLLTERVRQLGETAHSHPHVEVLALDIAGRNMVLIGVAGNRRSFGAKTLRRAVSRLPFRIVAVNLHQLREVNARSESIGNGGQIHLVAVRRQLNPVCQSAFNVLKERGSRPGVPRSCHPANHQLALRLNRGERPHVASIAAVLEMMRLNVLLLCSDERRNLINLNAFGRDVANRFVLVFGARRADAFQQPKDSAFGYASHADGRADRAAFNQGRDDRYPFFGADEVRHYLSIRHRFRIRKVQSTKQPFFMPFSLF